MDFRKAWYEGEIEAGTLLDEIERLRAELAASQARERVLHNATVGAAAVFADYAQLHLNKSPPDYEKAGLNRAYYDVLAEALSRASDDTALREMLVQAQEEMRERCAVACNQNLRSEDSSDTTCADGNFNIGVEECIDSIRALEVKP